MQDKTLKLYNTLSREIEDFVPIDEKDIKIYSCGPTVYHFPHLGNMRAYVFADVLNNALHALYPDAHIAHVINITDVGHLVSDGDDGEDKLEKGSKREGKSVYEIAEYYTKAFLEDLNALNIGENDFEKYGDISSDKFVFTFATKYMDEQISLVKSLEEKGYTYKTSDGIYFDTSKFSHYADFAKLNVKGLEAGERVDMGEKKNKTDFALWKFSKEDEKRQMEWESPWGVGFPGWHIECSAMSEAILGKHFDIHTGGIDHIPVHHTNEIAQSECAHDGEKYVNYWLHVNFLNDKSGKMSKSNDDFLRLQTLLDAGYKASDFRYLMLTTGYRKETEFSFESLDAAQTALKKLSRFMYEEAKKTENIIDATKYRVNEPYYEKFLDAMCEDLNTSKALSIVWEMIANKTETHHVYSTILKINKILGLDLSYQEEKIVYTPEALELIEKRKIARSNKDWTTSDEIREQLRGLGFDVVD